MTDPACKDCRFYQPSQSHSPRGYCHYNPPAHVSGRDMGYFVMVYGSDWCGRFAPKGQPEEHRRQIFDVYTGAHDDGEGDNEPKEAGPTVYGVPLSEYPDDLLGNDGLPTYEHTIEFLRRRYPRDVARRPELYTQEPEEPSEEEEEGGWSLYHQDIYGQEGVTSLSQTRTANTPEGQVVNRITLQWTGPPAERDVWQEYVERERTKSLTLHQRLGALAQNAYQRKMDEAADPILRGVIEGFTDNAFKRDMYDKELRPSGLGYQEIVAQVGMAMATLHFPDGQGIPMSRPGEKTVYFYGELWEFLSEPHNQSGIWLIDTERGFPPGPYQLRWENDRWYSDGELPKWPRA